MGVRGGVAVGSGAAVGVGVAVGAGAAVGSGALEEVRLGGAVALGVGVGVGTGVEAAEGETVATAVGVAVEVERGAGSAGVWDGGADLSSHAIAASTNAPPSPTSAQRITPHLAATGADPPGEPGRPPTKRTRRRDRWIRRGGGGRGHTETGRKAALPV